MSPKKDRILHSSYYIRRPVYFEESAQISVFSIAMALAFILFHKCRHHLFYILPVFCRFVASKRMVPAGF